MDNRLILWLICWSLSISPPWSTRLPALIFAQDGERGKTSMTCTNGIGQTPLTSGFWLESANGKLCQESKGQEKREERAFPPLLFSLLYSVVLTMPPSLHDSFCEVALLYGSSAY